MTVDPLALDFSDAIARDAFRALLDGAQPLSPTGEATRLAVDESEVRKVYARLKAIGRAEFDDADRLLGVYGLTLKPTQHSLRLRGNAFFVWCAFDAVGIPAALGESASIASACAQCKRELRFEVHHGVEPGLPLIISWLPSECDSIRDEFCPAVNFYCDATHYRLSPIGRESPDAFLTLRSAAAIGRDNWGWARATGE